MSDPFPVTPEDLQRVLHRALEQGGDFADVFLQRTISRSVTLEDGLVRSAGQGDTGGAGVRVIRGERTGYAYTEILTPEALLKAAETARQVADGDEGPVATQLSHRDIPEMYPVTRSTVDADVAERLDLVRRTEAAARETGPNAEEDLPADAKPVKVNVSLSDSESQVMLAASDGTLVRDRRPMARLVCRVIAEGGGERQTGSASVGARRGLEMFEDKRPEDVGRRAAVQAMRLLGAVPAPAGVLPVVLGNADSGVLLHEAVGHGLEADFNRKDLSNYSGQVGQPVASELCTVVDEGVIPGSHGALAVDDEGSETGRTTLIENGTLRGYMHDRTSARIMKTDATGNGRRESYSCAPMPRMTNTYLQPGESDPDEILASVDRGVYAVRFGGGQVDITKGDYVFMVTEGYLIEDGRVTSPVKGMTLIGNGPESLRKVSMVGNDLRQSDGVWMCGKDGQSVPVGVGMPTIKVDEIVVGGTG